MNRFSRVRSGFAYQAAWETNILEEKLHELEKQEDGSLTVTLRGKQIYTVKTVLSE